MPFFKVDLVAGFQAQPERPPKPFDAQTGIDSRRCITGRYVVEAVLGARGSLLSGCAEVDETGLKRAKNPNFFSSG